MGLTIQIASLERNGVRYIGSAPTLADRKVNLISYNVPTSVVSTSFSDSYERVYNGSNLNVTYSRRSTWPFSGFYIFYDFTELDTDTYERFLRTLSMVYQYPSDSRNTFRRANQQNFVRVGNSIWASTFTVQQSFTHRGIGANFRRPRTIATQNNRVFRLRSTSSPVIPNQSVRTNSSALTYNLRSLYSNETASTIYAVNSSSTGVCRAAISGSTLTLTPGSSVGTATINLVAWGQGQIEVVSSFTVTTSRQVTTNPPPTTAGTIPNISAQVSTVAQRVAVASYFRDTDTLTYSARSSNTSVATVSVSGSTLTVTPGSTVGSSTITVTATDTANQTATQTFTVTTTAAPPVNPAPTRVGSIPNRTAQTGSSAHTLGVSAYFSDTDTLTYSAVSSNTGVVSVSVSGSTLTMTPGSTAGSSTITVTATDTASQSITQTFTFTTTSPPPPNPAPTTSGTIPNQTAQVSTAATTLNVQSYFRDTDTLTYSAASTNTSVVAVSISGSTLTMTPGATASTSTITVTATDTASQSISQTFTFTTTAAPPPNPAPTRVGTIPNRTARVSTAASTLTVSSYFSDTDTLTYTVASSNTSVVAASISGAVVTLTPGSTVGSSTITVTATDTASQAITQTFTFTTTAAPPVNPAPTRVGTILNRTARVSSGGQTLAVASYFSDTDTLTYAAASSNTGVVAVSISGSTLTMLPGSTAGSSTITITATDTASQSITQTFTFTTTPTPVTNPAPTTVGSIPRATYQVGTGPHTLAASSYFSDTDTLAYAISSSHSTIASATISETTGAVSIQAIAAGTATITIVATDTANQTATQAFIITVTAVEVPEPEPEVTLPTVAAQIPDQTIEERGHRLIDMAPYFNDADYFFGTSRNPLIATAGGDGEGSLNLHGENQGTTEIVVSAGNNAAEQDAISRGVPITTTYATQSFDVTVIAPTAPLTTRRDTDFAGYIRSDDPPIVIDNPRKFFQWTGTGTISATSSDTNIATVAYDATANTLTITPVQGGWVEIEIALTYSLAPTVPDAPPVPTNLASSSPTQNSLTFTWTAAARATGYDLYITASATTPTSGTSPTASVGAVTTYTRTGLSASTTYRAYIRAKNSGGTSDWSAVVTGTTSAAPVPVPAVPTLTLGTRTASSIAYSWVAVSGATSYELYFSTSATAPTDGTTPTVTGQTGTTYTRTGLSASTTYRAYIRARNASGVSAWSAVVTGTTQAAAPAVPPVPTGLASSSPTQNALTFTWTAAARATGYDLYITTSAVAPTAQTAPTASVGAVTTYTRTGLSASTTYRAYIRAKNASGASTWSAVVTGTTSAIATRPPAVPSLTLGTRTATSIAYSWSAVSGATSYELYFNTSGTIPTSGTTPTVTGQTGTTYTRTGLTASTTYYAYIRARNAIGASGWSVRTIGTTMQASVPVVPTGLASSLPTQNSLTFTWTASPQATFYDFYITTSATAPTAQTSPTAFPGRVTTYTQTGLSASTTYRAYVRAGNALGRSAWSAVVTGTTSATATRLPAVPDDATFDQFTETDPFTWGAAAGATSYDVYVTPKRPFPPPSTFPSLPANTTPTANVTVTQYTLPPALVPNIGTEYVYIYIRSKNNIGVSAWALPWVVQ